jgi:hypothetical protein
VARGIGVRYSEHGLRALLLERSAGEAAITGVAAGPQTDDVAGFLTGHGFSVADTGIAVGLGPGDFLSCCIPREPGMDEHDMEDHLRWELGKKVATGDSAYAIRFAAAPGAGFLFAARKKLIEGIQPPGGGTYIVDVEPIALYNGCEGMGELGSSPTVLVSVEAEGISSVAVENGSPVAVDSFSASQEDWLERLPCLDFIGGEIHDEKAAAQFVKYASGAVSRLISRQWKGNKLLLEHIILAGGGVYMGDLASMVSGITGIVTTISNPFASATVRVSTLGPRLSDLGSAFTTCFGLALRALEE